MCLTNYTYYTTGIPKVFPNIDPNTVGLSLQGHRRNGPPIYKNSHMRPCRMCTINSSKPEEERELALAEERFRSKATPGMSLQQGFWYVKCSLLSGYSAKMTETGTKKNDNDHSNRKNNNHDDAHTLSYTRISARIYIYVHRHACLHIYINIYIYICIYELRPGRSAAGSGLSAWRRRRASARRTCRLFG